MKKVVGSVALLFAVCGIALAAENVQSGLEPGAAPPAFNVLDVTGPAKGESLCYRCRYGGRPVVSIFTREVNEDVAELTKRIDDLVAKNSDQKMAGFVVLLTDDPDQAEPKLEATAKSKSIKQVPLTVYEGATGPKGYKISDDAAVTVMMWVDSKVKVNHAFTTAKLDKKSIDQIVSDTQKILE